MKKRLQGGLLLGAPLVGLFALGSAPTAEKAEPKDPVEQCIKAGGEPEACIEHSTPGRNIFPEGPDLEP